MDITLREFTKEDIPRLLDWVNQGGFDFFVRWAGTAFDYPLTEAQLEAHLAEAEGPDATRRIFAAVDAATGAVLGRAPLPGAVRLLCDATLQAWAMDGEGVVTAARVETHLSVL